MDDCEHQLSTPDEHYKGRCVECQRKDRTCTVCSNEVPELKYVYIKMESGKEIARGHMECVEGKG